MGWQARSLRPVRTPPSRLSTSCPVTRSGRADGAIRCVLVSAQAGIQVGAGVEPWGACPPGRELDQRRSWSPERLQRVLEWWRDVPLERRELRSCRDREGLQRLAGLHHWPRWAGLHQGHGLEHQAHLFALQKSLSTTCTEAYQGSAGGPEANGASPLNPKGLMAEGRSRGARSPQVLQPTRLQPHRQGDLVIRREETIPPLAPLAAARHFGEQAQAVVLPLLDRVEVRGIVLDQRLDERTPVADVARLVTDPRAVIDGRQHVAARLGAVGQHREGAGPGRALGHEVALDEDLDAVLELEQVAEEAARGAGRFPRGQPVALGDAGPLEHFTVHL